MTTVKISQLPAILGAATATTDVLPLVDVSANTTNKITRAEFFSNVGNLSGVGTITGATTLSLLTTTTSALTLDSGTTGAINIGTNANAKTITIGNGTGATSLVLNSGTGAINIGTNAIAKTITIGNGTGATSLVLNAGTGAINIGTNAIARTTSVGNTTGASILNLQAGTGGVSVLTGTTGAVTIDSGTTGAINIGVNANAKTVTVGNGTGATSVVLNAGTGPINIGTNAVARTITVGNTTGASALALNAGTGNIVMTGNVGLGITPTQKLHVSGNILSSGSIDAGTQFLGQAADTASTPSYSWTGDTTVGMYRPVANTIGFSTTSLERMRIDSSGNVGIGTSSPANKLDVRTGTTGNIAAFYGTSTYHLAIEEVGGVMFLDANNGSATIGFKTNDTERMRLDSSGNLGLGVTPSAWATLVPAIQLGGGGSFIAAQGSGTVNSDSIYIGTNAHFNGTNWLYKETNHASYSLQANGQHQWHTAPSGTAGNAITFTQAMTLDNNGNLLVGTTTAQSSSANRGNITVGGSAGSVVNWASASSRLGYIFHDGTNMQINNNTGGYLNFYTSDTERARIDASGNLLVGTGSTFDNVSFLKAQFLGGIATKIDNATSVTQVSFFNPNGRVGFIATNGSATTYSTSSDYRLKENVTPMQNALATVAQLNPVTYTWKADGSAGQGFIAHELQAVVPDCVTGAKDAVDETGNPQYQGVDTSFLVATLVAAIKELKAEVDSLRAQLNP